MNTLLVKRKWLLSETKLRKKNQQHKNSWNLWFHIWTKTYVSGRDAYLFQITSISKRVYIEEKIRSFSCSAVRVWLLFVNVSYFLARQIPNIFFWHLDAPPKLCVFLLFNITVHRIPTLCYGENNLHAPVTAYRCTNRCSHYSPASEQL